ncbi:MAG: hypothetical protein M0R18_11875 [Deltaproteobacteria bacterium]|nr:hypothetical protein [Deltaproteobacteria bacterium]
MGHIRLGNLPRTQKWQQVVALIEGGAGTAQIANATITAAEQGFKLAAADKGLVETIWLLTQLPLAARSDNFGQALQSAGLEVSDAPGLMEVVGAFSDAIDKKLTNNGGRTDLGEMAQMAASETITQIIGSRTQSLFGTNSDDVKNAFSKLATNKQFSIFARDFFARLTNRCLDYFVSKAVSHHVGEGKRFRTLAQQGEFTKALGTHSREASKIIEEFSGGWFSKTNWEKKGISRKDAAGFAHVAIKKIVAELKEGAQTDD